jgi:molecular chaperone DnaK (HSP70)
MPGVPKMMMSLDCLIGEKDLQATIERDEFETAAAPLVVQAVSQCVSSIWKSVL